MDTIPSFEDSLGSNDNDPTSIPLLCGVCPDTPQFSDVSHLVTHIASKGHLHHETQTKLRAHGDPVASIALREYEKWYKDNAIEKLLVKRMKSKQVKAAAVRKRVRTTNPSSPSTVNLPPHL